MLALHGLPQKRRETGLSADVLTNAVAQSADGIARCRAGPVVPPLDRRGGKLNGLARDRVTPALPGEVLEGASQLATLTRRRSQQRSHDGKAKTRPGIVGSRIVWLAHRVGSPPASNVFVEARPYAGEGSGSTSIFCGPRSTGEERDERPMGSQGREEAKQGDDSGPTGRPRANRSRKVRGQPINRDRGREASPVLHARTTRWGSTLATTVASAPVCAGRPRVLPAQQLGGTARRDSVNHGRHQDDDGTEVHAATQKAQGRRGPAPSASVAVTTEAEPPLLVGREIRRDPRAACAGSGLDGDAPRTDTPGRVSVRRDPGRAWLEEQRIWCRAAGHGTLDHLLVVL